MTSPRETMSPVSEAGARPADARQPHDDGMSQDILALRHASIGYGDRPVLRGVDFRLRRGEVVALVGPNGSGKTTLVRGVLGLAQVTGGDVDLFGVPAGAFKERWRIGYVPQRHTVAGAIPSTVREVVASGRLPRKRWWAPTNRRDREVVAGAIATVALSEQADAPVATLSGGQQRRVLIARALASEPEMLVMDEPTAGVDAESQDRLARTLEGLVAQGLTLVVVTHEIEPLLRLLTRVVMVENGRITRDLPAAQVDARALGHGLDAGHDPHHSVAGAAGEPADPFRDGQDGWLGEPNLGDAGRSEPGRRA